MQSKRQIRFERGALCALALAAAGLAAGCTVGPGYRPPAPPADEAWHEPLRGPLSAAEADGEQLARWWTQLGDPALDGLVARALAGNPDLFAARERVREARARGDAAEAALYPTLGARITASPAQPHHSSPNRRQGTGLYTLFPVDLFGALRRGVEAALADLGASEEDLYDARVHLAAEVVQSYVDLRSLQVRIAIAERSVSAEDETAQIAGWRTEAGLTNALDVERARSLVEQKRSEIPSLRAELASAKNRLAVLVGEVPGSLSEELEVAGPIPSVPSALAVGVPAEALARRPDVRRAARQLEAETARIGVAKAAQYPTLTLSGFVGAGAVSPAGLGSLGAAAAAQLGQVIFDHGAIHARLRAQKAVRGETLARFRATTLSALEEVEDALASLGEEQSRREALASATDSAERAAALSRDRYASGLVDFLSVLDAERSLYSLQDQLASSERLAASDLVHLYRSLGGGWSAEEG